jgi:hypothetical protein
MSCRVFDAEGESLREIMIGEARSHFAHVTALAFRQIWDFNSLPSPRYRPRRHEIFAHNSHDSLYSVTKLSNSTHSQILSAYHSHCTSHNARSGSSTVSHARSIFCTFQQWHPPPSLLLQLETTTQTHPARVILVNGKTFIVLLIDVTEHYLGDGYFETRRGIFVRSMLSTVPSHLNYDHMLVVNMARRSSRNSLSWRRD